MNTDMTLRIDSDNSEHTETIGELLGKHLRGGEVIELTSDLGGGKTTMVRGIARGAGSADVVGSPTFTIAKEYASPNIRLYHYDFYRLADPGLVAHELHDALLDTQGVVLVEWGTAVASVMPPNRVAIKIAKTGEDSRSIVIAYPPEKAYLVQHLQSA